MALVARVGRMAWAAYMMYDSEKAPVRTRFVRLAEGRTAAAVRNMIWSAVGGLIENIQMNITCIGNEELCKHPCCRWYETT